MKNLLNYKLSIKHILLGVILSLLLVSTVNLATNIFNGISNPNNIHDGFEIAPDLKYIV